MIRFIHVYTTLNGGLDSVFVIFTCSDGEESRG